MRIAHIVLQARYSGAEILARDLSLAESAAGHSMALVSIEPPAQDFEGELHSLRKKGVQVFHPSSRLQNLLRRSLYIHKFVRLWKPRAMVAHSILPALYTRLANIPQSGCQVLSVLHSNGDMGDWKLRAAENLLSDKSHSVIGVSSLACENYRKAVRTKRPIFHIPNGINLSSFRYDPSARRSKRAELSVSDDEICIIQIGRICEQKQQLATINACRAFAAAQARRVCLVFVGHPELTDHYSGKVLSATQEPSERLRVLVPGARPDVPELLSAADICVMPSAWEAHSIAAIEAAASGIAMVMSDLQEFKTISSMPGVFSFSLSETNAFPAQIAVATGTLPTRFNRDMKDFDIGECANAYDKILGIGRP